MAEDGAGRTTRIAATWLLLAAGFGFLAFAIIGLFTSRPTQEALGAGLLAIACFATVMWQARVASIRLSLTEVGIDLQDAEGAEPEWISIERRSPRYGVTLAPKAMKAIDRLPSDVGEALLQRVGGNLLDPEVQSTQLRDQLPAPYMTARFGDNMVIYRALASDDGEDAGTTYFVAGIVRDDGNRLRQLES